MVDYANYEASYIIGALKVMSNKSIKRNYLYNLLYEVVLIITPFITTPYVSRVLGADGVGIYSFTYSVVTYFILFAGLGTTRYGQREVSYNQRDIEARSVAFWNTEIIRLLTTLLMLICYLIFSCFQNNNQVIYFILAINLLNVPLDISWAFQGMEEFGKIVGRNIIFRILTVISIFAFVRDTDDVAIYTLCLSGLTALASLSLWPFLKGRIQRPNWKRLTIGSALKTTLTFFVPTIAIQVYTYLDKTMIGVITGSSFQNGYYEQAHKIVAMALTVITSIGTVMIPRMGHLYANGKHDEIRKYLGKSFRFVCMLSIPMCLGIIVVSENFVPWFFGAGYDAVVPILRIFSLLVIVLGLNNVMGLQYLIPTGKQNTYTFCVIVGAVVNLLCNLLLIRRFGAIGATVASVFAEMCIAGIEFYIIRKEISFISIVKSAIKYLISGAVMFVIILLISKRLDSSIVHTMIIAVSGIISYTGMLLVLRDDFFIGNMKSVLSKLHIKRA